MWIRPAGGWSSETIISIILVGQSVIFQWHKMWHNDFNYYCWTQSGWAVRTLDLKFSIQRCFVTWTILLPNKHNVPVTCWYWCFKDGSHNDWLNGLHIIQWLTVLHCGKCRHHVVKSVHCYNTEHLKHCWTHFWQFGQIRYSGAFFLNLVTTLPTMQFSHWVTSLEAIYQITCSVLWSHKRLYITFSHIQ